MEFLVFILFLSPLLLGWVLDLFFGDPEGLPHPVVGFGKLISFGERNLNRGTHRKAKGAILAVSCILLTYFLTQFLLGAAFLGGAMLNGALYCDSHSTEKVPGGVFPGCLLYLLVSAVLVFYCLAGKTLRREVKATFEAVDRSVEEGRKQVARIVGRDTSELTPQEIRTAALETLAENLSDGVVAPLFWFFLLGVPGMMAYKMVNTLDSMIGYQNERYKDFGLWAAKIDDAANYIPARITALLIILAAKGRKLFHSSACVAKSFKAHFRFIAHFGPQHASPNSGWPEAALASVLDCRFGGAHNYFGEYFYKPYIGTNARQFNTDDMHLSLSIASIAETMMIVLITLFYAFNVLAVMLHI